MGDLYGLVLHRDGHLQLLVRVKLCFARPRHDISPPKRLAHLCRRLGTTTTTAAAAAASAAAASWVTMAPSLLFELNLSLHICHSFSYA
jgi:hypothetical protein